MNGKEQRIREMAFYLWEQEGRPDGQAERHWEISKAAIEQEDAERRNVEGEPPGDSAEIEQAPRIENQDDRPSRSNRQTQKM